MKQVLTILIMVALGASVSCASKKDFAQPYVKNTKRYPSKKVFGYSYSAVWDAANKVMNQKNVPVNVTRRDQGLITTDWQVEKSDQLFSGYGDTKIPYKVRFKMKLEIKPTKRGILVDIKSREQYLTDSVSAGKDFNGSIYQWADIDSSGLKESKLLDSISEQLIGSAPRS